MSNQHLASILPSFWSGGGSGDALAYRNSAGRQVVLVDPYNTSQQCSGCGAIVKKALDERWHSQECGMELDRDHNAALNILRASYQTMNRTAG